MTLGWKLGIVFCAFIAVLVTVIFVVFRERTRGKMLAADDSPASRRRTRA